MSKKSGMQIVCPKTIFELKYTKLNKQKEVEDLCWGWAVLKINIFGKIYIFPNTYLNCYILES
jgi:hypothetical protein